VLSALPSLGDGRCWPAMGGGPGGSQPMQDPVGRPEVRGSEDLGASGIDDSNAGNYAMHAVGDLEAVFVNRGTELLAYDPLRKAELWRSPSPLDDGVSGRSGIGDYGQALNPNMVLAAAVGGDVVVAALHVPDASTTVRFLSNYTIMSKLPDRRLFAFDRHTGKMLWSHFDQLDGPVARRFHGHAACGPPLILGDTVYAPVQDRSGAIAFYVGAYDLRTGQPRWRRLVCSSQQEVNMFGNARREFAASPMCAKEGVLYGCSNLGVCYAVEQATGRLRWLTAYDVLRMPETQLHNQRERTVYFQNSAPVVADGVVACTPLDSDSALAIDIETGKQLWRLPWEAKASGNNYVRWLFGALDGEFLFAGAGVIAVVARANAPKVRLVRGREYLLSDEYGDCPRPAVSSRWIYYPGPGRLSVFDREGNLAPNSGELQLRPPGGNLLLVDGILVSLSNHGIEVAFDPAALAARSQQLVHDHPDEPDAILQACTLRAGLGGDDENAQAELGKLYRSGLEACVRRGLPAGQPPRSTFQRQLFLAALQQADRSNGAARLQRLQEARQLAPDGAAFVRAEAEILVAVASDTAAVLRELDLLAARAGDRTGEFRDAGGTVPVAAYVLWRRANLLPQPADRVQAWQQLLEEHPTAQIRHAAVPDLATAAIADLIKQHGRGVYAAIEQRAAAELAAAGRDAARLGAIGARFPHSDAAARAGARLLDLAVEQGDLGRAIEVLAVAQRDGDVAPGLLRRVLLAAEGRGNHALARALRDRLLATAGAVASDWPADGGKAYAQLGDKLLAEPELAAMPPLLPPDAVLATIPNPSPRAIPRLLPTTVVEGFAYRLDTPAYWLTASEPKQLRAVDVDDPRHPTLFWHDVGQFAEHLWLCGSTLVVFDTNQVVALDYRSGEVRWQLPAEGFFYECFGIVQGVLLLKRQGGGAEGGDPRLFGFEPSTGRALFERVLPTGESQTPPKAAGGALLWLRAPAPADGAPSIEVIDPLSGRSRRSVPLGAEALREIGAAPDLLRHALLPQALDLAADQERVYVKVEPPMTNGEPRVVALRADGSVAWRWKGVAGRRLMAAVRGDRVVLAEGVPLFPQHRLDRSAKARVLVLGAADGNVRREVPLGEDFVLRNWQPSRFETPAPPSLLGEDRDPQNGDRRFVCIAIDDGGPTFLEPFGVSDDDVLNEPLLDRDLLLFGHRQDRGGDVRLHALHLPDRTGALAGGKKFLRLRGPVTWMGRAGAYTVVVGQDGLTLLGPDTPSRSRDHR
jgi:outer membrane protein assembly factor BamB